MIRILFLIALAPVLSFSQTTTGDAQTGGPCSPANTGNNNTFRIDCGISKEQGQKMLDILNKILANQLDPNAVMVKLDEILKAVTPKHLVLDQDQQKAVRDSLSDYPGKSLTIVINQPTEETDKFGDALMSAIISAGLHPTVERVLGMFVPDGNCRIYPGIWMIVGANRRTEANALAIALGKSGVVEGQVPGCSALNAPDNLTIAIFRP